MTTSPYNFIPYFQEVCNASPEVKTVYLKVLRATMLIVTQNLTEPDQIRGIFRAERITRADLELLAHNFPEGIL